MMTTRKFLLWFLLLTFCAYSSWAMWQLGYFGIWAAGFTSPGSLQILLDLVVCCILITSWLKKDAESRGINPYPWILATFATGSIAPLIYLLVREYAKKDQSAPALHSA